MAIPFSHIPNNLRTPLFFVEFDNSMANSAIATQRSLIIGQMLDSATATPDIPVRVSSAEQAASQYGHGSLLHGMVAAYLANDSAAELWVLPLKDGDNLLTAKGLVKVSSLPTNAGVISLYIAGQRVQVTVMATDNTAQIAAALATAINRKTSLPVIATAANDTVTLTARNKGAHGNGINLCLNYRGQAGGEVTPAGLALVITPMTGGAGAPELKNGLSNLSDRSFDFIVNPYTDTASMDEMKSFLSDIGGRWSWEQQLYGHAISVVSGTYGELADAGARRNNQHETLVGVTKSPTPNYIWSAAVTGAVAPSLRNDPGRPLQTLPVAGVLAPAAEDRLDLIERNNLLHSGISTVTVADDGTVQVENLITTYQKNPYGDNDDSYLQIETLFLLAFVSRYIRTQITSKFRRMKLAKDGTRFAAGSAIVTPNVVRAELIAQYRTLEYNGYVQDSKVFASGLKVEINAHNPNRLDVLWTGTLISQLRVFALLNQFRL
ncbi:phage tail sheath subtilisin-like domain-containing protein [Xenorhabdus bovienii]|uniref:Mu-like prophage FluMu tail sheath protein n=1 Tax=Xenorhabdus bovienii str. kraussei Becker Underwood TaxID=1398204 RepID=A0A077PS27_XENBV|nr:phage tail sheath subtilisin-like domain-containing protein [Xenorhabdus bovienii]CDH22649.1 Mu-like prophage FluMu tail sheath protein [Xenorhabdus bovienii str. kraussei Becker Underwood]